MSSRTPEVIPAPLYPICSFSKKKKKSNKVIQGVSSPISLSRIQKNVSALKNRYAQLFHTRNVFFLTYPHEELDILVCDLFDVASYRWRSDNDFIQETFVLHVGSKRRTYRESDIWGLLEQGVSLCGGNHRHWHTHTQDAFPQAIRSQRSNWTYSCLQFVKHGRLSCVVQSNNDNLDLLFAHKLAPELCQHNSLGSWKQAQ
jgi:hypothetical protein